jgi:signal transduction histidine kinase
MAANAPPAPLRFIVPPQSGPPQVTDLGRRHLARHLHDSVIQRVLAVGLAIDWCMGEVPRGSPVHEQLTAAKRQACGAVRELRSSLQELTQPADGEDEDLPDMLVRLLDTHATARLCPSLQVHGTPQPLPLATRRWLYSFASECLFNSAVHAAARRAAIRLRYCGGAVTLCVADDGHGKPRTLRKVISGEVPGTGGYHFGLADIAACAREMGWTLRVSRADLGGIAMEVQLPTRQVSDIAGDADD